MAKPLAVIIEDQANLALLYEDALRLVGYETIALHDGLAGLNHLELNDIPDLVILDVNLPRMSGRDILKHIRSSDKFKTLPVIILTANSLMVDQIRPTTTELDYLFVKPIGMPKLQELAKSMKRKASDLSSHLAETQKVPHLDEDGTLDSSQDVTHIPLKPRREPDDNMLMIDSIADTQEHVAITVDDEGQINNKATDT